MSYAQINGYARVSAIAGTTLTVANVNQTFHTFIVGQYAVIMQMQDNVIGANTADNTNFGNLSAIGNAGRYEIRLITAVNGNSTLGFSSGTPTSVTLSSLTNFYNTGTNSRVQLITFRRLSATNFTTTANITALAWNGDVGGVIALEVPGILTLNHNITADGAGFRGGAVSNNYAGGTCFATPYRANDANAAFKGEGIYRNTTNTYLNGRAKILNGGGGGVSENGGGGGGGNFTTGGIGGGGYNGTGTGCTGNFGYGFGGISLGAQMSANRIFMGGGGGGGQQNNTLGTPGGNGGGIILIKAGTITTSGACAQRIISANGLNSAFSGNDGAGGGGAAGTIVFNVNNWNILAACDLFVQANGGTGGTVNDFTHGAGGAGGQGVVQFNAAQPTTNITTTTLNGSAGCNNNSVPCTNFAGSASGSNNSGIIANTANPLPIELLYFTALKKDQREVELLWKTATELNNSHFTLEKSEDGENWEFLAEVKGAGTSTIPQSYQVTDENAFAGVSYYRLSQTDLDGHSKSHGIRAVQMEIEEIMATPNPAENWIEFHGPLMKNQYFELFNMLGQTVYSSVLVQNSADGLLVLDISNLEKGVYLFKTNDAVVRFVKN